MICPICHADRQNYQEMMGEPCFHGHTTHRFDPDTQFALIGISGKNYAYWLFLDNKVAHPQSIENTIPYEVKIWRN